MPIFEYRCQDCGAQFEKLTYGTDDKILCKQCSSARVEKQLSVFAVSAGSSHEAAPSCASGGGCCGMGGGRCGE